MPMTMFKLLLEVELGDKAAAALAVATVEQVVQIGGQVPTVHRTQVVVVVAQTPNPVLVAMAAQALL